MLNRDESEERCPVCGSYNTTIIGDNVSCRRCNAETRLRTAVPNPWLQVSRVIGGLLVGCVVVFVWLFNQIHWSLSWEIACGSVVGVAIHLLFPSPTLTQKRTVPQVKPEAWERGYANTINFIVNMIFLVAVQFLRGIFPQFDALFAVLGVGGIVALAILFLRWIFTDATKRAWIK